MSRHTHQNAPTQYAEAKGIRFAYHRFGKTGAVRFGGCLPQRNRSINR